MRKKRVYWRFNQIEKGSTGEIKKADENLKETASIQDKKGAETIKQATEKAGENIQAQNHAEENKKPVATVPDQQKAEVKKEDAEVINKNVQEPSITNTFRSATVIDVKKK